MEISICNAFTQIPITDQRSSQEQSTALVLRMFLPNPLNFMNFIQCTRVTSLKKLKQGTVIFLENLVQFVLHKT